MADSSHNKRHASGSPSDRPESKRQEQGGATGTPRTHCKDCCEDHNTEGVAPGPGECLACQKPLCVACGKAFNGAEKRTKAGLITHMSKDSCTKKACPECDCNFSGNNKQLRQHRHAKHNPNMFKCSQCDYTRTKKVRVKSHQEKEGHGSVILEVPKVTAEDEEVEQELGCGHWIHERDFHSHVRKPRNQSCLTHLGLLA